MSHRQWKVALATPSSQGLSINIGTRPRQLSDRDQGNRRATGYGEHDTDEFHGDWNYSIQPEKRKKEQVILTRLLRRPKDVILGRVRITRRGRFDAGAPGKMFQPLQRRRLPSSA